MDLETEDVLDLIGNDDQQVVIEEDEVQNDENQTENVERDGSGSDGEAQPNNTTIKPKRVVRNPQPKLNAETLKGPKGLSIMKDLFSKQKFRGKGKEEQDLDFLLTLYSYWGHRLFPKFTFEQCITRIENLGRKKPVITYVKKLRLGMEEAAFEEKELESDNEEEESREVTNTAAPSTSTSSRDDTFDLLIGKKPEPELTNEQIERIRINRERALKLREERLKCIQQKAQNTLKNFNLDENSLIDNNLTVTNSQNNPMDTNHEMDIDDQVSGDNPIEPNLVDQSCSDGDSKIGDNRDLSTIQNIDVDGSSSIRQDVRNNPMDHNNQTQDPNVTDENIMQSQDYSQTNLTGQEPNPIDSKSHSKLSIPGNENIQIQETESNLEIQVNPIDTNEPGDKNNEDLNDVDMEECFKTTKVAE